jgi:predicted phosphodiesterase
VRIAVISDIHGNLHALEAVLESIDADAPETVWCLGDLVGYGPRPNRCCALVAERAELCLIGNHDLGVLGRLDLDEFSPDAAASARWTAEVLSDESRAYLEPLEPQAVREDVELYHASPRDPIWEYVLSAMLADLCLTAQPERIALIGHSHVALSFDRQEGSPASGTTRKEGTELDIATGQWLINPGSTGQPRDGDPRAAWLMLDTGAWTATYRRAEYDIAGAMAAIRAANLPESLAERLQHGQ